MKKECTENEARLKAEAYCSLAEHCKDDVFRKLEQWGAPVTSVYAIVEYLEKEKFIDEQRYAVAYVRDKYRFNQWGRIKIAQALKMKNVPSACISMALEEIDADEYRSVLLSLLERKWSSVKGENDYIRRGKVIRFAAGHGYGIDEIMECMKRMGCQDGDLD